MNLLLLLSALLSVLAGANAGVRRPDVAQTIAVGAVAARPAETVATRGERPLAAMPTLVASAALATSVAPLPVATVALWAGRRRE